MSAQSPCDSKCDAAGLSISSIADERPARILNAVDADDPTDKMVLSSQRSSHPKQAMSSQAPKTAKPAGVEQSASLKRIDTVSLFAEAREIVLVHHGEDYRLRVTAKGKLLLTK